MARRRQKLAAQSARLDPRCQERRAWRQRWFSADTKQAMREEWNGNFQAYMDHFDFDDAQATDPLHQGMMLFRRFEATMTPKEPTGIAKYFESGHKATAALLKCLTSSQTSLPPEADFVFISLDIEGSAEIGGCKEFGYCTLDTRNLSLSSKQLPVQDMLKTRHFAITDILNKFLFGTTIRLERGDFRDTIANLLNMDDEEHLGQKRNIVLLAHGTKMELNALKHLGIALHYYPQITGIIDTGFEGQHVFGYEPKLFELLTLLGVPFVNSGAQCSGNDARWAMQALIGLLVKQYYAQSATAASERVVERLEEIATSSDGQQQWSKHKRRGLLFVETRSPAAHRKPKACNVDWIEYLNGEETMCQPNTL